LSSLSRSPSPRIAGEGAERSEAGEGLRYELPLGFRYEAR
jgi:hypothetical protein